MMQELTQQIEDTARAVVGEIHTALPGTIVSFDAGSGMAVVKPIGKYRTADGHDLDYPQISDVPVTFPFCQASGVGFAFPVSKGDSCLIIVSEVELDEWRSGAESEGSLRFDLTSAMCVPGLLEGGGDIVAKAQKSNAAIMSDGDAEVMVSGGVVTMTSGSTKMILSDAGVAISGDLKVTGNISSTKDIKAQNKAFLEHTHKSAAPGESTGKPE